MTAAAAPWKSSDEYMALHIETLQSQRRDSYRRKRLASETTDYRRYIDRALRAERLYDAETEAHRQQIHGGTPDAA